MILGGFGETRLTRVDQDGSASFLTHEDTEGAVRSFVVTPSNDILYCAWRDGGYEIAETGPHGGQLDVRLSVDDSVDEIHWLDSSRLLLRMDGDEVAIADLGSGGVETLDVPDAFDDSYGTSALAVAWDGDTVLMREDDGYDVGLIDLSTRTWRDIDRDEFPDCGTNDCDLDFYEAVWP